MNSEMLLAALVATIIALPSWAAYITQRRRESPEAVATMAATQDELAQQIRDLQQSERENHRNILLLQSAVEAQRSVIAALSEHGRAMTTYAESLAARLRELGQNAPPPPKAPRLPQVPEVRPLASRSALARRIEEGFSREEIDSLAYDLGLLADEIAGQTRAARAENLVELAFRRGILHALKQRVDEERPQKAK